MAYLTSTVTTVREDGTRHYHTAKPRSKASFPADAVSVEAVVHSDTLFALRLDHDYDYDSLTNRYSGTSRVTVYGSVAELEALHASIGRVLYEAFGAAE
jgi:hypothetical protein